MKENLKEWIYLGQVCGYDYSNERDMTADLYCRELGGNLFYLIEKNGYIKHVIKNKGVNPYSYCAGNFYFDL